MGSCRRPFFLKTSIFGSSWACRLHLLQVSAVRPDLFGTFSSFTTHFCDGHRGRFGDWDASGSSNLGELHGLLRQFMVRPRARTFHFLNKTPHQWAHPSARFSLSASIAPIDLLCPPFGGPCPPGGTCPPTRRTLRRTHPCAPLLPLQVRRLKRDVLTQLPAKRRTRVVIELGPKVSLPPQWRGSGIWLGLGPCGESGSGARRLAAQSCYAGHKQGEVCALALFFFVSLSFFSTLFFFETEAPALLLCSCSP